MKLSFKLKKSAYWTYIMFQVLRDLPLGTTILHVFWMC